MDALCMSFTLGVLFREAKESRLHVFVDLLFSFLFVATTTRPEDGRILTTAAAVGGGLSPCLCLESRQKGSTAPFQATF